MASSSSFQAATAPVAVGASPPQLPPAIAEPISTQEKRSASNSGSSSDATSNHTTPALPGALTGTAADLTITPSQNPADSSSCYYLPTATYNPADSQKSESDSKTKENHVVEQATTGAGPPSDTVSSASSTTPTAPPSLQAADKSTGLALPSPTAKSFSENRNYRAHRKNAYSIDSVPKQTIMKALVTRPPPTSELSISSLSSILHQNNAGGATASLDAALHDLHVDTNSAAAAKLAALASPAFFHKRFNDAVNIDKVLEEIEGDEGMSHSRLMQTATSVREVSKQLQRRPIRRAVKNIMIVTKARDNQLVYLTRELAEWLLVTPRYGKDHGVHVYVDAKLQKSKRFDAEGLVAKHTEFKNTLRYWTPDLCWTSPEKFDLVLTLGGDGTVLYTSWLFQRIVPPILSFSLGSLGFLTNFQYEGYKQHLDRIMGEAGMRVNLRMRFTCTVYRAIDNLPSKAISSVSLDPNSPGGADTIEAEQFEVLNELLIDRGPSPYISQLELYGDNNLLTIVQADGCIFSTPTGSTAYSLSAGGSLVHPDIPAILLTPICPHTLSFRPMVLSDSMLLRVSVPRNSRATAYCAFDGKGRVELRQGDCVTIAASQYPFPTVLSQPTEWFDSIGRTLRWNTRGAMQKAWDDGRKEGDERAGVAEDDGFDIDIEDVVEPDLPEKDSGVSDVSASTGRRTPSRKGTLITEFR